MFFITCKQVFRSQVNSAKIINCILITVHVDHLFISSLWKCVKKGADSLQVALENVSLQVYVVERMSAEGKFFHRACFRCDYCNILLRLGRFRLVLALPQSLLQM